MRHVPALRRRPLLVLAVAAVAVLLPASGQSRLPPEDDGSTYTWAGAATLTVDVKPWGGGYVRSNPYLIDCPLACVRPFDLNREVTLTAYVTPGHTPGHVSVRIVSRGEEAVITGDLMHHPVQCAQPRWASRFDVDAEAARHTRLDFLTC